MHHAGIDGIAHPDIAAGGCLSQEVAGSSGVFATLNSPYLVTAGVEMDVLGSTMQASETQAATQWRKHIRSRPISEDILQTFYDGIRHKPETTFGNVRADVLADKDPGFHRGNFYSVIRNSARHG
jgi:hypothetical protein